MPGKTTTYSDSILNLLRGVSVTAPAAVYVGLFIVAPLSDSASGTEFSGNGYARKAAAFGAPAAGAGTARKITNTSTITFGPAIGSDWPSTAAWGLFDAVSGGNLLYWDVVGTPKVNQVGDSLEIQPGDLTISED